jgi:NADH kinase
MTSTDIDDFEKALESVYQGNATILCRMRLACSFYDTELKKIGKDGDGKHNVYIAMFLSTGSTPHKRLISIIDWQVMNEIALHRGSSPHLNTIDIFVDGQHLTEAVVCSIYYFTAS